MKSTNQKRKEKISLSDNGSNPKNESAQGASPRRFSQDFSGPSRTQQHFAQSCDINNIINSVRVTGVDPHAERAKNQNFGFASSQTFEEALRQTSEVESAFELQPSKIRAEFENNPALWLDSLVIDPTPTIDSEPIVDPAASEPPNEPETAPVEPSKTTDVQ